MCFCVFVFVYLCIFHKHVVEMGWLQELCLAHMKTSLQSLSGLSTWLWLWLCVFTFCLCNCKTQSGFCCTWLWWDTGTTNCVSQYEKLLKMTSTQLCVCVFFGIAIVKPSLVSVARGCDGPSPGTLSRQYKGSMTAVYNEDHDNVEPWTIKAILFSLMRLNSK